MNENPLESPVENAPYNNKGFTSPTYTFLWVHDEDDEYVYTTYDHDFSHRLSFKSGVWSLLEEVNERV
jgi:hypothetical protein